MEAAWEKLVIKNLCGHVLWKKKKEVRNIRKKELCFYFYCGLNKTNAGGIGN